MGGVGDEPLLGADQALQLRRHLVEGQGQREGLAGGGGTGARVASPPRPSRLAAASSSRKGLVSDRASQRLTSRTAARATAPVPASSSQVRRMRRSTNLAG